MEGAHIVCLVLCNEPLISLQVCTKVASFLEQGSGLETLSRRAWHLQSLTINLHNTPFKRELFQHTRGPLRGCTSTHRPHLTVRA